MNDRSGAILGALLITASLAAPAAAADPAPIRLEGQPLRTAAASGLPTKPAAADAVPAPTVTELRATLGADGRVHTHCVDARNPAFAAHEHGHDHGRQPQER